MKTTTTKPTTCCWSFIDISIAIEFGIDLLFKWKIPRNSYYIRVPFHCLLHAHLFVSSTLQTLFFFIPPSSPSNLKLGEMMTMWTAFLCISYLESIQIHTMKHIFVSRPKENSMGNACNDNVFSSSAARMNKKNLSLFGNINTKS